MFDYLINRRDFLKSLGVVASIPLISKLSFADTETVRIIPFVSKNNDIYEIELGHKYLNIYLNKKRINQEEIKMNFEAHQIREIVFTQYGESLLLVHRDEAPAKLTRLNKYNWMCSGIKFKPLNV